MFRNPPTLNQVKTLKTWEKNQVEMLEITGMSQMNGNKDAGFIMIHTF